MSDKNKVQDAQPEVKPTGSNSQSELESLKGQVAAKAEAIEKLHAELKESSDLNADLSKQLAESNDKLGIMTEKYQELQAGKGKSDTKKFSWTKQFAKEQRKK